MQVPAKICVFLLLLTIFILSIPSEESPSVKENSLAAVPSQKSAPTKSAAIIAARSETSEQEFVSIAPKHVARQTPLRTKFAKQSPIASPTIKLTKPELTKSERTKKTLIAIESARTALITKSSFQSTVEGTAPKPTGKNIKQSMTDKTSKHGHVVGKRMEFGTKGKWTVVHFWATWCGSCVEASPELVKLHAKYAPEGVEFFGINLDKDPATVAKYVSKVGITWPQMMTKQGWQSPVRLEYEVPSIPAVYLVSPDGQVIEAGMRGFKDADTRLQHHLKN